MKRLFGVKDFLNKKFKTLAFAGDWSDFCGQPEENFSAIVYGMSGNGKTDFCMQFAKMLSRFDKVYYNSFEQGISKSLQECLIRQKISEVAGRIVFGHMETFEQIKERLAKKKSPKFCFIDSRDYMGMTTDQFKELKAMFPKKCFIIICHEDGAKPKGNHGKSIEFMVDIKIRVRGFVAMPRSRFGGNMDYTIWAEGAAKYREHLRELKLTKTKAKDE
jgi:hypothetical protein